MADEKFSNFLTEIIDADLAEGKVKEIHTRFPPEPNGYLHIGSAKAIYINYMTAKTYGGKFNLRFDDTNPAREGDEYVQSILKDLEWLGATPNGGIFYGSDDCVGRSGSLHTHGIGEKTHGTGRHSRNFGNSFLDPVAAGGTAHAGDNILFHKRFLLVLYNIP